jgi:hypothetical protein
MEFKDLGDVHEHLCNYAAEVGNRMIANDTQIPAKWKGDVLRGASPYTGGEGPENGLSLFITEAYASAPDRWHKRYQDYAVAGIRQALADNQEIWIGSVLGEARYGRSYFDQWEQAPDRLF